MCTGRGASYIGGVYDVGLLNVSCGVPLQICVGWLSNAPSQLRGPP